MDRTQIVFSERIESHQNPAWLKNSEERHGLTELIKQLIEHRPKLDSTAQTF